MAYYYSKRSRRRKNRRKRFLIFFVLFVIVLFYGYRAYQFAFKANVWLNNKKSISVYIPTGANFDKVKSILYSQGIVVHRKSFEWMAKWKKYPQHIKAGHYVIVSNMNNLELVNMLRSGKQVPVSVKINSNIKYRYQLASKVSQQIEADSLSIIHLLKDNAYLSKFDRSSDNIMAMFLANTYEFYWNSSAEAFIQRMFNEYKKFWSETRIQKAKEINLTPDQVTTLASIVELETVKAEERPIIAGVYMNRLKGGWPLQADPTLIYAMGDYSIKRVLSEYKTNDSPYNTYKHKGLPPGPICIVSDESIDAVLNYDKNKYLYFCAKEDFSGYHNFATSYELHQQNARKYQRALNELNIRK